VLLYGTQFPLPRHPNLLKLKMLLKKQTSELLSALSARMIRFSAPEIRKAPQSHFGK
jgi:hypothetical protein